MHMNHYLKENIFSNHFRNHFQLWTAVSTGPVSTVEGGISTVLYIEYCGGMPFSTEEDVQFCRGILFSTEEDVQFCRGISFSTKEDVQFCSVEGFYQY